MKIISSEDQLAYFKDTLTENIIVDVNSDLKHRIFPRPFERLSNLKDGKGLVGVEIGVCGGGTRSFSFKNIKDRQTFFNRPLRNV